MRALIVGAGAVGQVYGLHLQRGGAEVGFFVKERQAAQANRRVRVARLEVGAGAA